jgi:hypothetical protein
MTELRRESVQHSIAALQVREMSHHPILWLVPAVIALAMSSLAARPSAAQTAQAAPDLSGVYWATTFSPRLAPATGGAPPYKPEAMAALKKNTDDLAAGKLDDMTRSYCLPDGVPRALEAPYPFEIIQVPQRGEIYLIYEINHMIRRVDMQKPLPPDNELNVLPFYAGHSAGHWEGDTLVIETAGYNETTFLDNSGAPHSDQLRTTERIRKVENAKALEDVVTIHDPAVFTKDWTARFIYQARPDIRIMDWNCGEKHRDLSQVKGVRPQ